MATKIDVRATQKLLWTPYPDSMIVAMDKIISTGWLILAVEQRRGHCDYQLKEITIPCWVMRRSDHLIYTQWYLSHELAHVFTPQAKEMHGDEFMAMLKTICPPEAIGLETTYQARSAVMNGIGCFDF